MAKAKTMSVSRFNAALDALELKTYDQAAAVTGVGRRSLIRYGNGTHDPEGARAPARGLARARDPRETQSALDTQRRMAGPRIGGLFLSEAVPTAGADAAPVAEVLRREAWHLLLHPPRQR